VVRLIRAGGHGPPSLTAAAGRSVRVAREPLAPGAPSFASLRPGPGRPVRPCPRWRSGWFLSTVWYPAPPCMGGDRAGTPSRGPGRRRFRRDGLKANPSSPPSPGLTRGRPCAIPGGCCWGRRGPVRPFGRSLLRRPAGWRGSVASDRACTRPGSRRARARGPTLGGPRARSPALVPSAALDGMVPHLGPAPLPPRRRARNVGRASMAEGIVPVDGRILVTWPPRVFMIEVRSDAAEVMGARLLRRHCPGKRGGLGMILRVAMGARSLWEHCTGGCCER
jgi:hypothetical protein